MSDFETGSNKVSNGWGRSFGEAYCEKYHSSPGRFPQEVLWRCFYKHALLVGRLIFLLRPSYFQVDLWLIITLGKTRSWPEFFDELRVFMYRVHDRASFLRGVCRIRVSGERLVALAMELAGAP